MTRVAIFAALGWECAAARHPLRGTRRRSIAGAESWSGRVKGVDVLVVKTGIGPQRALESARAVLRAEPADLLVSTGCAGGLDDELAAGDLAVATRIAACESEESFATDALAFERAWQAARRAHARAFAGTLACSERVLAGTAEKAAAGRGGAIAVEMEGVGIARAALEAGVPFAAVRAILDPQGTPIALPPDLLDPATGEVRPARVAAFALGGRGALPRLIAAGRAMAAARRSLERFFTEFLRECQLRSPSTEGSR